VERRKIIDGRAIRPGDALIGLASSGAHSNGYSLIRKIVERARPDAATLDALMAPTRIYVRSILRLLDAVPIKGLAHITGGGLVGNVPRMLPAGTHAVVRKDSWPRPPLFQWLQAQGDVAEDEMHRVFNCGIGMVLAVAPAHVRKTLARLKRLGEEAREIGVIEKGKGEPAARVV
jgi:phosphoribosylformylglycinamidine cyclo-ligase